MDEEKYMQAQPHTASDGIDDLRQGGVLSRSLPGYEERPAQIEMATLIVQALQDGVPAVLEAATGTGKSLSYLCPIVRSGKVAIISTANKALQDQLFFKDILFVQQHVKPFKAALVKGVGNYICLDRLEEERTGIQYYAKHPLFERLAALVNDPASLFAGDLDRLGFQLPADIRGRVHADTDQCAWHKCNFYLDCFVRQMRDEAANAQVIVVNHTILLLDAAIGGMLLPQHDCIVIDEAHHLEEEATRAFTTAIKANQIHSLLALKMLRANTLVKLQDAVLQATTRLWQELESRFPVASSVNRVTLSAPIQEGLRLATSLGELVDDLRQRRPLFLAEKEEALYDKLVRRANTLSQEVRSVFSVEKPTSYVYYLERVTAARQNVTIEAAAAPLDVAPLLRETLFKQGTILCTSATLATVGPGATGNGSDFTYFRRRVGLDHPHVIECVLPLVFDYPRKALLYLPRTIPEPAYGSGQAARLYQQAIAQEMLCLVKASRGRAFLLFSSRRMLDEVYEQIAPQLSYPVFRQGDLPRAELTRRFRAEIGAVLFGLKSFWEGVDIAGEALSLVVIDKLPFDPPDDPVHEARVAQMKAAGENWFGIYVLPQAVLRLKQGVGRLLRTHEDRGVMAILDVRLHTKGYGRQIRSALPPARPSLVLEEVERFFA
jgi:Rad3-related DNA helicase